MNLHRLRVFILSHGFHAWIEGDHVAWLLPGYNSSTGETTFETLYCKSFNTARDQLGY